MPDIYTVVSENPASPLAAATSEQHARFKDLYEHYHPAILGYVLRRCTNPEDAADAIAETFLIAWRRLDEVPDGEERRLWLYGVARRVLARSPACVTGLSTRFDECEVVRKGIYTNVCMKQPGSFATEGRCNRSRRGIEMPMQRSSQVEALVVRVVSGSDPGGQLEALCELRRELDSIESELAAEAIRAGMSWREIGAAIGVSKQAAHRRHRESVARLVKDGDSSPDSNGNANGGVNVSVPARRAVRIARQEAASLGSDEVGTEHLLLGILQCGDEQAAMLLRRLGVTLEGARDAVQPTTEMTLEAARRAYANSERAGAATLVSPVARRILERALTHAAARDSSQLTALDLLRSLVMHDESGAARTLTRMGVDPGRLRTEIISVQDLRALPRV